MYFNFKTAAVLKKFIMDAQSYLPYNVFFFSRQAGQDSLTYSVRSTKTKY